MDLTLLLQRYLKKVNNNASTNSCIICHNIEFPGTLRIKKEARFVKQIYYDKYKIFGYKDLVVRFHNDSCNKIITSITIILINTTQNN